MKRNISILFAIILFIAVIAVIAKTTDSKYAATAEPESREQWEYLVVSGGNTNLSSTTNLSLRKEPSGPFSREAFPLEQNMDKLGTKGWELVSVSGNPADPIFYFKRKK